jgi:ribosomal protein L37AE/L43A
MNVLRWFLNKLGGVILAVIFGPLFVAALSKLKTGYWKEWYSKNNYLLLTVVVISLGLWAIFQVVAQRMQQVRGEGISMVLTSRNTFLKRIKVGELEHAGVIWDIQVPEPVFVSSYSQWPPIEPSEIEVVTLSRCPKCMTEMEERKAFFSGYIWSCVNCHFSKRNRDSMLVESERVAKKARRQIEEKNSNQAKR